MGYLDNTWHTVLSDIGSIASLAGLGFTIYVAWNLRNIKNNYIFRVRAPDFIKTVEKQAKTLLGYGNNFANTKQEISVELVKVDVRLQAIEPRMRGSARKAVKEVRLYIKKYETDSNNRDSFDAICNGLIRVIAEVQELHEDLNLE